MRPARLALSLCALTLIAADAPEPTWTPEQKQHWSFIPPTRPQVPKVERQSWVRNPIDAFILQGLESFPLSPTTEATPLTLIRRLSFDLTGLPPTPEQVDAFLADISANAYDKLVDRLLASPAYGERWARQWLDLARFAESDGFKADDTRPNAWRYRDWVVKALNSDLPIDQFLALQLAGDEIAPGDADAFLATAFNRHWPYEYNNKIPGQNRQLMLDDVTDTTASVFLGLTLACARCHDHKYDPLSHKDYYRFQGLFASFAPQDNYSLADPAEKAIQATIEVEHQLVMKRAKAALASVEKPYVAQLMKDKLEKLPKEVRDAFETEPEKRSAFQEDLLKKHVKSMTVDAKTMRSAMAPADKILWDSRSTSMKAIESQAPNPLPAATGMYDLGSNVPPVRLLRKGNFYNPGDEVEPGFLSVLTGHAPWTDSTGETSGRRKALADWMVDPKNPLTARVIVNRLWQGHFGRGIVASTSDFGTQGTAPSHPELLDWLATELVRRNWSLKALHRLMVTSATYRQGSLAAAQTVENDPENTLLSRMPRHRLEGEAVRDALLASSGQLNTEMGGPSVFPDLPPGMETRGGWTRSAKASDRNRRSLYVFVRRNLKYPLFDAFDAPDTNVTCPERNISVTAPQALMLLNSDLVLEQAQSLAGRVLKESDRGPAALVTRAYRLTLGRQPDEAEMRRALCFLEDQPALLSGKQATLPSPLPDGYDPTQGSALVDFCHVLLNLNEFVFVD